MSTGLPRCVGAFACNMKTTKLTACFASSPNSSSPLTTRTRWRSTSPTVLPPFGTCTCSNDPNLSSMPKYADFQFPSSPPGMLNLRCFAQSDILSIGFSPFHPNLVVGGTYSGQILLWDTRSRHSNPVLKTPLSASGHTHPVYSLSLVGTQNAHSLVSASTDGVLCTWTLDMLARPQETLELVHPAHNKTDEVSVTALGFPLGETTTFWCATEEGNVYAANRYDRAGAKAGLVQSEIYRGHSGPVTGIDFHPVEGSVDLSDLFLTCGVDWTVKLWRAGGALGGPQAGKTGTSSSKTSSSSGGANAIAPLLSFEEADDYVFDVKWHPLHPAVFGTVDGAGKFDLFNLNTDTEVRTLSPTPLQTSAEPFLHSQVPIISTAVGESSPAASRPLGGSSGRRGLNKLAWERKEGRRAAIGSSDGKVYVYELSQGASRSFAVCSRCVRWRWAIES